MFLSIIISFLLGIVSYVIINNILYFFIPVLFTFIILIIYFFVSLKNSIISKYIALFFYIILLIFQIRLLYIYLLTSIFINFSTQELIYNNPAEYEKAKISISHQERIKHFPSQIPQKAYNIELYKTENKWFGSEAISLQFSINKDYTENEINKHKYIAVEKLDELSNIQKIIKEYKTEDNKPIIHEFDAMMTNNGSIKINNYTFYIINDKFSENNSGFFYHYGIGINDKGNRIIYYYTCPD